MHSHKHKAHMQSLFIRLNFVSVYIYIYISPLICMWSEPCLFPLDQNDWSIKFTALLHLITRFRLCLCLPSLPCLLHGVVLEKAQGQFYISCVLKPIELTNIYLIIFMCKVLKCNNQQTNKYNASGCKNKTVVCLLH